MSHESVYTCIAIAGTGWAMIGFVVGVLTERSKQKAQPPE